MEDKDQFPLYSFCTKIHKLKLVPFNGNDNKSHLSKVVDLYARYDDLYSKDNWNISKDESAAIVGAQIKLGKYVKIAPNVRMTVPKADGSDNVYSAYINCYFGF